MRASLAALLVVAVGLVGCGGGESSSTSAAAAAAATTVERPSSQGGSPESGDPGAGAQSQSQDRAPVADADADRPASQSTGSRSDAELPVAAAGAAREIGREACAGMSPLEAAAHFEVPARRAGVDKEFAAFVADPPPSTKTSPGFPRLVAALYASTLPAPQRADAAAGCAEELASAGGGG